VGGHGPQAPRGGVALNLPPPVTVGLCASCVHARIVRTRTGSTFYLCELSAVDPAFDRYPRLPVVRCAGYRPDPDGPHPAR
jgi:hypothetical protein